MTLPLLNILMTEEGSKPISAEDSWRGFNKAIKHGYRQFYIKHNEQTIGVIGLRSFYDPLETNVGYEINNFVVDEKYRGQGFGRRLFEYTTKIAKDEDANWIRLFAYKGNENAQAFYKKNEFQNFADLLLWEKTE